MKIELDDERRRRICKSLRVLFEQEFDQELSDYRATEVLEFFLRALGPAVYNQAIGDARQFMLEKLGDLDVDFYVDDPQFPEG